MKKVNLKTAAEIATMQKGGERLAQIREKLAAKVKTGVTPNEIEELATRLIKKAGGKASFKMVPGYSWATCINVNDGVVHGVPEGQPFNDGDLVSIDLGIFYEGFHTDTSTTVLVGRDKQKENFLAVGQSALQKAIAVTQKGNFITDISRAMETTLEKEGLTPIQALVGHGIGRELHEAPAVPCFIAGNQEKIEIKEGLVLAIEIMYTQGSPEVVVDEADQWTIRTKDGKIAGLFEETVAVTKNGPRVLTTP